jgi:single-strand DNA-binding protein
MSTRTPRPAPARSARAATTERHADIAVLRGVIASDPVRRVVADGTELVSFDLAITLPTGRVGVPVVWPEPGGRAPVPGSEVVVVGAVRRRFFNVAGATQTRTEVVADRVVRATATAAVRSAIGRVVDDLGRVVPSRSPT